jgi:hypothetical protein
VVIDTAAMITRLELKDHEPYWSRCWVIEPTARLSEGEGARASCHGIIKAARVAAAALGAKAAAETAAAHGVKVAAVSLHRTLTR